MKTKYCIQQPRTCTLKIAPEIMKPNIPDTEKFTVETIKDLKTKNRIDEMIICYKRCMENQNFVDANRIQTKILSLSRYFKKYLQ